jgi:putative transcriptional regulator
LADPNFFRSVVLMCAVDGEGAFGLVLNRPSDVPVGDHLPGWVERLTRPEVVFVGGPVQPATAIGLGLRRGPEPPGWSEVAGRIGLVDLTAAPGDVVGHLETLRVFSGYAGWGAGQLEDELATGDWVVASAVPEDAFGDRPDNLWRTVLKREGGRAAMYADFPIDPRAN